MRLLHLVFAMMCIQYGHGMFITSDPVHINTSPYMYASNKPNHLVDRNGKMPVQSKEIDAKFSDKATISSGYPPMEPSHVREYIVEDEELHALGLNLGVTPFLDEFTEQCGGLNWQEFHMLKNRAVFSVNNSFQEVEEIMDRTVFNGGKLRFNTKRLTSQNFRNTDLMENIDSWLITEMEIRRIRDSEQLWENTEWWRPQRTWVNREVRQLEDRYHLISGNSDRPQLIRRSHQTREMNGINVDVDRRIQTSSNVRRYATDSPERYVRMTEQDMHLMGITPLYWKLR